jgi:hypothetical protein
MVLQYCPVLKSFWLSRKQLTNEVELVVASHAFSPINTSFRRCFNGRIFDDVYSGSTLASLVVQEAQTLVRKLRPLRRWYLGDTCKYSGAMYETFRFSVL